MAIEEDARIIRTAAGLLVKMPTGFRYTKAREESVERFAREQEKVSGQRISMVFFNRDYGRPGQLNNITFLFECPRMQNDDGGTPGRFDDEVNP